MELYVKSQRVDVLQYTMPNVREGGHYCSAGYRSQNALIGYSTEDEEALAELKSRNMSFSLIDLSACTFGTRLRARMTGIKRTPAIILDDGTKIEGINQIREYLKSPSTI
jgi:hypothetical protein